jgi:quercetin dioxygenase-like cupin family protein
VDVATATDRISEEIPGGESPPFSFLPVLRNPPSEGFDAGESRRRLSAMDEPRLERWSRADGALTEKRMMRVLELEGYDVLVYTYRAGTVFPEHEHARAKCDGVLEGILRVTVGGETFDLAAGDRLYLPAGTRHAAQVIGSGTVLSLDGTLW